MAHKHGFTEEKSTIISKLQAQVEQAQDELRSAQIAKTSTANTLTDATIRYTQNESNKTAAKTSFHLSEKLSESAGDAERLSKSATHQAEKILKMVHEQLEDAHRSALVTIDAAHQTLELTRLISKTKVTHKLLSDLLVVDVKNAEADAHSAVTDAVDAVSASITAAQSAILAHEFLQHTNGQTSRLLELITAAHHGLKDKLHDYYQAAEKSETTTNAGHKEAQKQVKKADEKLGQATTHYNLIVSAHNAAVAAVSSAV